MGPCSCGARIYPGASFCGQCGARVAAASIPVAMEQANGERGYASASTDESNASAIGDLSGGGDSSPTTPRRKFGIAVSVGILAVVLALGIGTFTVSWLADRGLDKSQFRSLALREKLGGYSYVPFGPYDDVRYDSPEGIQAGERPEACNEAAVLARGVLVDHGGAVLETGGQALLFLFNTQSAAVKFRDREAECLRQLNAETSEEFRGQMGSAVVRRHVADYGINAPKLDIVVVTYRGVDASVSCADCSLDLEIFARKVMTEIDAVSE